MPDYTLLHLYRKGGQPFHSLSALPDDEALPLMRALYLPQAVIWERFEDPEGYLRARRQAERWLRETFIAKGGRPSLPYPLYMVLGRSPWMVSSLDPVTRATTSEIEVPLSIFSAGDVSFTYPDSMVSLMIQYQHDPRYFRPELHGQVFTWPEMQALIAARGQPEEWQNELPTAMAQYIEAQVWNDLPLRDWMHRDKA